MTLGPIVGLLRCAPPRPPHPKSGRGTLPLGDKPHGGSYGEVLLICRGYLLFGGLCASTAHLVALLRHFVLS